MVVLSFEEILVILVTTCCVLFFIYINTNRSQRSTRKNVRNLKRRRRPHIVEDPYFSREKRKSIRGPRDYGPKVIDLGDSFESRVEIAAKAEKRLKKNLIRPLVEAVTTPSISLSGAGTNSAIVFTDDDEYF
ncbi:MAG: hypothetical protein CL677_07615 [Bdellovibrionaceae bacterium]|nr:hypothetical protein [Pseudobdellovibrionaceae bacterium]|tara:strand:+ start:119704 stop:120099 length:396 start_codon:yes stop_codon:yes gene_type:complete